MPVKVTGVIAMGPINFAFFFCEQGTPTTEQRGPMALAARDMQIVFDEEVARRANLTDAQLRAEGISATDRVTLTFKKLWFRLLLSGG